VFLRRSTNGRAATSSCFSLFVGTDAFTDEVRLPGLGIGPGGGGILVILTMDTLAQ
jgi:hypothetical protein